MGILTKVCAVNVTHEWVTVTHSLQEWQVRLNSKPDQAQSLHAALVPNGSLSKYTNHYHITHKPAVSQREEKALGMSNLLQVHSLPANLFLHTSDFFFQF